MYSQEFESHGVYMYCAVNSNEDDDNNEERLSEVVISSLYTWKTMYSLSLHIAYNWPREEFSETLNSDLNKLKQLLFQTGKDYIYYGPFLRYRLPNRILEHESNSDFQHYLYDFLPEQQSLYKKVDDQFDKCKTKKYISISPTNTIWLEVEHTFVVEEERKRA